MQLKNEYKYSRNTLVKEVEAYLLSGEVDEDIIKRMNNLLANLRKYISDDVVGGVLRELDNPTSTLAARQTRAASYIEAARQKKSGIADAIIMSAKRVSKGRKANLRNRYMAASALGVGAVGLPALLYTYLNKSKEINKMNKKAEENLGMSPLQAILQQGAPGTPERPGNPVLSGEALAGEEAGEPAKDTRKLTIADKGMDGNEIKMSVESSKDNDERINFLLSAFTDKTKDDGVQGEVPVDGVPEPAEGILPPAQVVPTL